MSGRGTDADAVMTDGPSRSAWRFLWLAAGSAAVLLSLANVIFGNLNQDEGWYLLAAVNSACGKAVYRDFMFTQGSVMPSLYGFFLPVWYPYGVLGGRILTAVIGLSASALAALTAYRMAPRKFAMHSAFLAFIMIACSPAHSYFTSIPKTYALAALFFIAGFTPLADSSAFNTRKINVSAAVSGIFLALAACVRISLGAAVAVMGIHLLLKHRNREWRFAWLFFGAAAFAVLFIFIGIPALRYPEQFAFAQSYHAGRTVPGLLQWLVLRAGFASLVARAYPLLCTTAAVLCIFGVRAGERKIFNSEGRAALISFLLVTAVHALAPFPYDDYQTPAMPLLAAVAASALFRIADSRGIFFGTRFPASALVCAGIFALASPLLMDWVAVRQDRFWFEMKKKPDVLMLKDAAREIRGLMPSGGTLFTQDAYLAVEAKCGVPSGMEMGPFCIFPWISDDTARRMHVHTPDTLNELLSKTDSPVCALSGYSFAVSCPSTEKLPNATRKRLFDSVSDKYEIQNAIRDFGQGHTVLTIGKIRE